MAKLEHLTIGNYFMFKSFHSFLPIVTKYHRIEEKGR